MGANLAVSLGQTGVWLHPGAQNGLRAAYVRIVRGSHHRGGVRDGLVRDWRLRAVRALSAETAQCNVWYSPHVKRASTGSLRPQLDLHHAQLNQQAAEVVDEPLVCDQAILKPEQHHDVELDSTCRVSAEGV